MTLFAQRNDIEPMFGCITKMMMPLFSLIGTFMANVIACFGQLACANRTFNCVSGLYLLFTCFCLVVFMVVSVLSLFARFCVAICSPGGFAACSTPTLQSVGVPRVPIKLRQSLDLLAFRAGLCLNVVKHIVSFPNSMLEPLAGTYRQAARFIVSSLTGRASPNFKEY